MADHSGHRDRMRQRFLANGFNDMAEHEILEMLLFYSIPRKNTNDLAHLLLDEFISLSGVLDASVDELVKVPGITYSSAVLLKMMVPLFRQYCSSKTQKTKAIKNSTDSGNFLLFKYIGINNEVVTLTSLNSRGVIKGFSRIAEGDFHNASFSLRKIVEAALKHDAAAVILAHNHPSGVALPSKNDIDSTIDVFNALKNIGVVLIDHIILSNGDYISLADSQEYKGIFM